MKAIKLTRRSSSVDSKTSSDSESSFEDNQTPTNDFDKFLSELKSEQKAKQARNNNHSLKRINEDMRKYNIKVQSFEPISISSQYNETLLKEKPNLRVYTDRRLVKCTSDTFQSEKNIFKSSPLLSTNLWRTPSKNRAEIIKSSTK